MTPYEPGARPYLAHFGVFLRLQIDSNYVQCTKTVQSFCCVYHRGKAIGMLRAGTALPTLQKYFCHKLIDLIHLSRPTHGPMFYSSTRHLCLILLFFVLFVSDELVSCAFFFCFSFLCSICFSIDGY